MLPWQGEVAGEEVYEIVWVGDMLFEGNSDTDSPRPRQQILGNNAIKSGCSLSRQNSQQFHFYL